MKLKTLGQKISGLLMSFPIFQDPGKVYPFQAWDDWGLGGWD